MKTAKQLVNHLRDLQSYGQSVWLDYIRRSMLLSGELKRHVDEDGLAGVTSNPSIFEKAIAGSSDYAEDINATKNDRALTAGQVFEQLAIKDIKMACDILRPVYDKTNKGDGFVSIEVSPLLANDTDETIKEARRLWKSIDKPNLMVKVPGTPAGIPAIKQLISEGINVNVTLLFSQATYERVADAYIAGLEERTRAGQDVSSVASVASFFISRIDSMIDEMLTERIAASKDQKEIDNLKSLEGKVAVANAKLTYQRYRDIYNNSRWRALANKGAKTQRLLWASTSTKNPKYPDTKYVDELIGDATVNTMPPSTIDAFRDHGNLSKALTENVDDAARVMKSLSEVGISMQEVTDKLVEQGVDLFVDSFNKLIAAVEKQRKVESKVIDRQSYKMPDELDKAVKASLKKWQDEGRVKKLWAKDSSIWTNEDENKWLAWLSITEEQIAQIEHLQHAAEDAKKGGFTHALLLGMGGSSLCPEVMAETFGQMKGCPQLHVLDSTDPAQIQTREKQIDVAKTLFIVSSKSGTTLEPNIYKQYFYERAQKARGTDKVGDQFIAITDPGSKLDELAEKEHFRHIFHGVPGIGGRYSALSDFGMVPAAVMGIDVSKFLDTTEEMVHACAATVPVEENPGAVLGTIMGVLAKQGRDKVTLIASPAIYDLGAWLEQLLAESTGKQGHGLIPVDREELGAPDVYGKDRLFVYIRLESKADAKQDKAVDAIEKAGHPVVRIAVNDVYQLGQEFFRWEIATAVAGSIIGINAFNQPDVEASKIATRKLTTEYESTGALPKETPLWQDKDFKLFTDSKNTNHLNEDVGQDKNLAGYLKAHLGRIRSGDYFALLGYIEMNDENEKLLQEIRHLVRDRKKVATCLGFGPRFLHSTGQAYKGGPNTGVFLQVTCDDKQELQVPGQKYTFGVVKSAQARGDFEVLAERNRRALRVHLGPDVKAGLKALKDAIQKALT